MDDRNYRKYAIKRPNNLKEILIIDDWAKNITMKILKIMFKRFLILIIMLSCEFTF